MPVPVQPIRRYTMTVLSFLQRSLKSIFQPKTAGGFTLSELLVVILTVTILASVTTPIIRSKINGAKWSEANTTAGIIRSSISAYVALNSTTEAQNTLTNKKLSDNTIQSTLGFTDSDLTGTYFVPSDYEIVAIDSLGHAAVKVTASQENAPKGIRTLKTDGQWQ